MAVTSASSLTRLTASGPPRAEGERLPEPANGQVLSLTRFYSVGFSQSIIGVKKCNYSLNQGLRQLLLTVSWDLFTHHNTPDSILLSEPPEATHEARLRAIKGRQVILKSPSRVPDQDEGVTGGEAKEPLP